MPDELVPLELPDDLLEEIGSLLVQLDSADTAWLLDLERRELVVITERTMLYDEAEELRVAPPPGKPGRPAWQLAEEALVQQILAHPERYLEIPVGQNPGAPGRLSRFARSLAHGPLRDAVYDALRGKGAYRRVKAVLAQHRALPLWNTFEREANCDAARSWLRNQGYRAPGGDSEWDDSGDWDGDGDGDGD